VTPEEVLASARVFALPLKREFRGITVREGLLIEGPSGWGEFAPFWDHSDEHAGRWLSAALEQAFGRWPTPVRQRIPVNAILPMTDPVTTLALVDEALAVGCTTIKVKVGADRFDDDVERVAAIRAALDGAGVDGAIRVDANQRWTTAQAIERVAVLDAIAGGLEYVEQPVADRAALLELRRAVDVRIAVDEGIRLSVDPMGAARALREVADVAVLKAIPLGGVGPALELAAVVDLPVVVSGSLDTAVGLSSGLWLAATLPALGGACGLGTGGLLAADVLREPSPIVDGSLLVRRVVPDALSDAPRDDAMLARWEQRLRRAWPYARPPQPTGGTT